MAAQLKTELTLRDKNFSAQLNSACRKAQASLAQVSNTTKGFGNILGGLGGQLGKTVTGLSGMAGAFSSLLNPVTAVGAAVGLAGKAFFDYNKHLEETQRLTKQFTGLDGNQLSSLTNGIQAVADATDHEYKEILDAVDQQMKTFGIDGETALNQIKDGFVAGGDLNGNFLDNLKQYKAVFKDLGLAGDEFVAVMAQTRSGLFDENGAAAIQMASKNIGNMSKKTKQDLASIGVDADAMIQKVESGEMTMFGAIQHIAGALKDTDRNTQAYGAVLQDVFGKKGVAAGDPFVQTLANMSTNMDEVKGQTGEEGQVLEELINTTREWNNACESLFGMAGGGFADMGKKMKIYILQNLTKIINRFIDLYNKSTLVRAGIAAIAVNFKNAWAIIKAIFRQFGIAIEGIADAFEHLVTGDWGKIGADIDKTIAATADNALKLGKEMGDNIASGLNQALHGHIDKVTTEDVLSIDTTTDDDTKPPAPPTPPGGKSGKGNKDKKDEPAEGSLEYLEQKLKDLQDKYKKGLIKLSPEEFQKQVKELEDQIEKKKIEMYPELDPEGVPALKKQLQKLKEDQETGKIKLSADEYRKQVKDLEDKIEAKEIEKGLKLPPNEIEKLEKQLKELEDNQLNVSTRLDATEYKKQHKELEQQIESKKIEWGVSLSKDDLDKELKETLDDFRKKSSFELAVGIEPPKSNEDKLSFIQDQMDENDALLEQLKELQKEYEKLGEAGAEGYQQVSAKIAEVNAEQTKLGGEAQTTDGVIKQTNKMSTGFSRAGEAVGAFGDVMSSLSFDSPELNVAGTIAQAIAQIALGAGQAIAQAGEMGPWAWVAFGITAMAQLAAMISQLHSITGYASGGIVSGGKTVGDKNLVRINSGEMVLNKGQQGRLWNMINSNSTIGNQPNTTGQVEFKLRGADLYGSFKNYKTLAKKQ